jgi:hypothetical protein
MNEQLRRLPRPSKTRQMTILISARDMVKSPKSLIAENLSCESLRNCIASLPRTQQIKEPVLTHLLPKSWRTLLEFINWPFV